MLSDIEVHTQRRQLGLEGFDHWEHSERPANGSSEHHADWNEFSEMYDLSIKIQVYLLIIYTIVFDCFLFLMIWWFLIIHCIYLRWMGDRI